MDIDNRDKQNQLPVNNNNDSYRAQMKKIYDSIKSNQTLKNHINFKRDDRIHFIQTYPYDNLPNNETFVFNNLCMFNDLSNVNGYIIINDNIKVIDFTGSFKLDDNTNVYQRCLLPEDLFYQKYNYVNKINALDKKLIDKFLLK